MTVPSAQSFYLDHGARSDPGRHRAVVSSSQGDIASLCAVVQGLLMHDTGPALYGLEISNFPESSRDTLSAEKRLDQFCNAAGALNLARREPEARRIGTCRDFALLMTGLLRVHGVASRVRCGFAAYFTEHMFDDHWICEVWCPKAQRWQIVDAQLDDAHRRAYAIAFDPLHVPRDLFLTADQAWQAVRTGRMDPSLFKAGDAARGAWMICVNLARDYLALCKQETSDWDRWRDTPEPARTANAELMSWADGLAAEIAAKAEDGRRPQSAQYPGAPFWNDAAV